MEPAPAGRCLLLGAVRRAVPGALGPLRCLRKIEAGVEKLGQPVSHGCVRLSLADAKWFFHHVPNGTMIVIYNCTAPDSCGPVDSDIH
ncbi:L,D-transpeptidase [Candidatus Desulforudis audaxviator]|uniref:L,D-transpeptidase n=1 Tax=Candidatus Desulforudis audaxviator TaxID=471827 RepID=UPI000A07BAC6